MPVLSDNAIGQLAVNAGWTGSDVPIAVAIALAESGGNSDASNPSGAKGLWQVMWALHGFAGNPYDPQTNAKAAHQVFVSQGWNAWTVHMTGAYLVFLPRGNIAATNTTSSGNNNVPVSPPPNSAGGSLSGLQTITMGGLWVRVGAFLLGTILLVEGVLRMSGANKTIVQVAKTAAKAAVA